MIQTTRSSWMLATKTAEGTSDRAVFGIPRKQKAAQVQNDFYCAKEVIGHCHSYQPLLH